MRHDIMNIEAKNSVGIGAPISCLDYREKCVQVGGTFTATIDLEGTVNGTDWVAVHTFTDAGGVVEVAPSFWKLRLNTTAFTSGAPTGSFSGFNSRTE